MTNITEEFKSGMPDSIVLMPPKENTSIGFSTFEAIYQTPYKNAYTDILIRELLNQDGDISNSFNNIKALAIFKAQDLNAYRFARALDNIEAIIYKFTELENRKKNKNNTDPLYLHSKYFTINETNSLLFSIKRTIEFILSLIKDNSGYSIGNLLSTVGNVNKDKKVNGFTLIKTDFFLFKLVNSVVNASKHSLLYEDTFALSGPGYDRFFAMELISVEDFEKKIDPIKSKYFFWSGFNGQKIHVSPIKRKEKGSDEIKDYMVIEYNIATRQVMNAFLDFAIRYVSYFSPILIGKSHTR